MLVRIAALLLLISVVSGQITLGGSVNVVYGTLDTIQSGFETVQNVFDPNEFRGTGLNSEGDDENNLFGLGATDHNPDGEYRSVWLDISYYYRIYDIYGLSNINVIKVNPYEVIVYDPAAPSSYVGCIQILVEATLAPLPYSAYMLFPTDPKSQDYFFVCYSLGVNKYQKINRTNDFRQALQLLGLESNTYCCEQPSEKTTILEVWDKIYD